MTNLLNQKLFLLVLFKRLIIVLTQILVGVLLGRLLSSNFSNQTKFLGLLTVIYIFLSLFLRMKIDNTIKQEKENIMLAYENEFPLLGSRSDIIKVSLGIKDENFTYITIHFVAMNKKDQEFSVKIMDTFSRTI